MSRAVRTALCLALATEAGTAASLLPPTANRFLLQPGAEARAFVGTAGQPWTSGLFGCVRGKGWQFHEGIDIRCVERDGRGEPVDPVRATAAGTVAYVNRRPSLSNYGNYVVLRHRIDGLEIYSLYAHLREIRADLRAEQPVAPGEPIGVLGRTANTGEGIPPERAHLHFELNLLLNDRFSAWRQHTSPKLRNDHGNWNGQNLVGLDPRAVLLAAQEPGFSLLAHLRQQRELCRVMVRATDFPWARRYAALIQRNPVAEREGVSGFEISLNHAGLPFRLVPRARSEMRGSGRVQLLSVNANEYLKHPCRRLVTRRAGRWELAANGEELISLLTY